MIRSRSWQRWCIWRSSRRADVASAVETAACGKLGALMTTPSRGRLDGTVALVTGASSGIGEATAVALSRLGAAVAVVARRSERLEALATRLREDGGTVLVVTADITDEA